MSRVAKWKLEKTKVKVVFRLQFHATHVPQSGWDKLFISFIPADTGKATTKTTAKTTKANVRNGTCKWSDPIYETTRLLQDSKTKQYDEKFYKFVVAMGSSRSSILGEASINLAEFVDALKPYDVAVPLHGCNAGTILHVTVQLLTSKTGFREFEQQRELREKGLQAGADLNRNDVSGAGITSPSGEVTRDLVDKVSPRVRFRPESKELPSLEEEARLTEEYADSALGFEGSSNTSESLYAEKQDASSAHEVDSLKSTVSGDLNGPSHCQSPREDKSNPSEQRNLALGSSDWGQGWSSDYSMDHDLSVIYEENNRLRSSLELAESSILELKVEVNSLRHHAEEFGTETQKFSQQLAAEIASGIELANEVSVMKSECSKLKGDLQQLKSTRETSCDSKGSLFKGLQLEWEKNLLVVEDKIKEILKKVYLGYHDQDLRFLHSDLESLLILAEQLKQVAAKSTSNFLPEKIHDHFGPGNGLDVDMYQPPDMLHCLSIPSVASLEPNSIGATDEMRSKILELLRELDESKVERESLARKMDQMECYYEALVQELEESQKQMLVELQNLRNEHSTCLYTIASTGAEIESLHLDMNEKILRFSEERNNLDSINKELEKRALTSEAALRRARLNYSIAVDQLQKDLDLLSFQVVSMFESNESLIRKTFPETSRPESEVAQYQSRNLKTQAMGGDIILEDMKKSLMLQEGLYQKVEEELSEMHMVNVSLDVFSKILQETVYVASSDIIAQRKKIDELVRQLDLSIESNNLLTAQLQTAADNVQTLNEYRASCVAKCSDMALRNEILESELESFSKENLVLKSKLTEAETQRQEYKTYESKYEACIIERTELTDMLKQEKLKSGHLQNKISLLTEELEALGRECRELTCSKENLQKNVKFLEDKLGSLLVSYYKQFEGFLPPTESVCSDLGSDSFIDLITQLEEAQRIAGEKIQQLLEENKVLEDERDVAHVSSRSVNSKLLAMKQKFKHELQDMASKIEVSNVLAEKLFLEFENFAKKLDMSSEAEEKYAYHSKELMADLALLEAELQELTSKNVDFANEVVCFDAIAEELERSKLKTAELTVERQDLMMSLQGKSEESVKLAHELDSLKESMRLLKDELDAERSFRGNLESTVTDLTSQLKDKDDRLLQFSQMEAELVHFRQLASNLALENSRVCDIYPQHEQCLEKLHEQSSCLADLEAQLLEMHADIIDADIKLTVIQQSAGEMILQVLDDKKVLEEERNISLASSCSSNSEIVAMKKKFKHEIQNMANKVESSKVIAEKFHSKLENLVNNLHMGSEAEDRYVQQNENLLEDLSLLEVELQQLTSKSLDLRKETSCFDEMSDELERSKLIIAELTQEMQVLKTYLEDKTDESVEMASKLDSLEESMKNLQNELDVERDLRGNLEDTISDLTSQLTSKNEKVIQFLHQEAELVNLRKLASDVELEKSGVRDILLQREEHLKKLHEDYSCLSADQETQLSEFHEHTIDADVKFIVLREQYEAHIDELALELKFSEGNLSELHNKLRSVEGDLNHALAGEARCMQENAKLVREFESLSSELKATSAQNQLLSDLNSNVTMQLEEYKKLVDEIEADLTNEHNLELEKLKNMLTLRGQEIDQLTSLNEELGIREMVLLAKLDDLHDHITYLEENNDELATLENKCNDLTRRLSEQILKTEEFKNLSVHLKDLKDKAEAESVQVREKRESEGQSVVKQETLRIAFIKEQYETKLQELKHQLLASKKHGEEMLLKLQDVVDELENRKRSEASFLKRNEELSLKILELESELQSAMSDKRERISECDGIKTELECALLSLECCKEEKQKIEVSLQACHEENNKLASELSLTKGQLESSAHHANKSKNLNNGSDYMEHISRDAGLSCSDQHSLIGHHKTDDRHSISVVEDGPSTPHADMEILQEGISKGTFLENKDSLQNDASHLAVVNDHFRMQQSLKSSMDHLQKELERMKKENSLHPPDEYQFDPTFQGLQTELVQLHEANEELGSIFPSYNEFPDSGNALERVLALEIELADALREKKKSSMQSSFLKQHSNEHAIFQSFRDINELIKEMLELKGRYTIVERELKDMHDRYSQLSLQFAEVEGERQKLTMTLKNIRSPKKFTLLSRSSSIDLPS